MVEKEPDDAAMIKLHDEMNAALIEYERAMGIEKKDGDGAIVVPFVAKMHELIEKAAMVGVGTCQECHATEITYQRCKYSVNRGWKDDTCQFKVVINNDPSRRGRGNICECDKCGYRCARGFIDDERFKHCPNCGRRIEVSE